MRARRKCRALVGQQRDVLLLKKGQQSTQLGGQEQTVRGVLLVFAEQAGEDHAGHALGTGRVNAAEQEWQHAVLGRRAQQVIPVERSVHQRAHPGRMGVIQDDMGGGEEELVLRVAGGRSIGSALGHHTAPPNHQ